MRLRRATTGGSSCSWRILSPLESAALSQHPSLPYYPNSKPEPNRFDSYSGEEIERAVLQDSKFDRNGF